MQTSLIVCVAWSNISVSHEAMNHTLKAGARHHYVRLHETLAYAIPSSQSGSYFAVTTTGGGKLFKLKASSGEA